MDARGSDSGAYAPRLTVSRYIVETLRLAGIDAVFGLPGVHILSLWNALCDSPLRCIGFRHEHAAAHAADGYGRVTGKPGVVVLSTGPGALNTLSALAEAFASSSPVLAITSAIPTQFYGKRKGYLHEVEELTPAFEVVTRFTGRPMSADEVPSLLHKAITAATGGRPGPAIIEIPTDLFDAQVREEPRVPEIISSPPNAAHVEEAVHLLQLAARPLIWAGGGVIRSRASAELTLVAEKLGAPVVTTFMGKGALPENHALSMGTSVRQPELAKLLREADLMLAVGTRFSGMSTGNWKLELPSQLIHVDIDSEELGRNYPVRLGIAGDAQLTLAEIDRSLVAAAEWQDRGRDEAEAVRKASLGRAHEEGPREMAFLNAIRDALGPEVITTQDMTIPSYWSAPFFKVTTAGTFLYPYGYASLGFSFPAAIGAAAANPSQPVVAICGDGGFQYHLGELATVAENQMRVTVVVFNDKSWGVLKAFSEARYGTSFGMDIAGPDFVKLAEAYGIPATSVAEPDELETALTVAVRRPGPSLIEVPGAWKLPPPTDYYR